MSANKPDPSSKYRDVHAVSLPSLATQKRKRVKRKANAEQRDVFRGIELEADSGGRPSYMPYEKLYFPRITRESKADPQAELQNLFTVGQLHHEGECGPSGPHVAAVREYEVSNVLNALYEAVKHGLRRSKSMSNAEEISPGSEKKR